MMKAFVNAYAVDKLAAFAVMIDDKTYVYTIPNHTINSAEMIAALFAIKGAYTNDIEIRTNNRYALQMLECKKDNNGVEIYGEWFRKPINNIEIVEQLRKAATPALKIIIDKESPEMETVKMLSRKALGKAYDSKS